MRIAYPVAIICGVGVLFAILVHHLNDDPVERLHDTLRHSDVGFVRGDYATPRAAPVRDAAAFAQWQARLRAKLVETFDFDALNVPSVSYTVHHIERLRGGLVREIVTFESFDGTRIPAVRQRLERTESGPAVLLLPGHTKPEESGLTQLVHEYDSYQHAAATQLARAGYTTLTFELRGFGLLGKPLNTEHRLVAFNALLDGSFYKKVVLWDAAYALSLLRGSQGVETHRVGVAGASLGGELAVALAALVDNIHAIFFAGYSGSVGAFGFVSGDRGRQPHYCHIIPGARSFMRSEDVLLLLAPRAVLGTRGEHERPASKEFRTATTAAWRAAGATNNFEFAIVSGGVHEFFVHEAIEFFHRTLRNVHSG